MALRLAFARLEHQSPRAQVSRATCLFPARERIAARGSRVERTWSDTRARPHEEFLADAVLRAPTLAPDVELVRRALGAPLPDRALPELGAALRRIEQTLTTTSIA